ncbi:6960_t:CDS:10 [Funneliformis geosporum]|uniref:6960_t:CDS:1 n=1 Tax=Funneliformis geosporum TaxID=1117311 RepID=A0A9W4SRM6_9GLOM|nr:6960_t:CDS:10 [Funneliformis geosporum]
MGILEKISEIEKEISRTQKNKEPTKGAGVKGEGFDVMKSGDARVALIGFPSVGKSTLLNKLTKTHSEAGAYEFTTLTCIPGKIEYNGANIQLLDLPGIIEGASQGKGRGRQVIAVARTADLIVMMLDATKSRQQRFLLERELEAVGIRLNCEKPNVYFKVKKGGGISFNATVKLTHLNEKMVYHILHDYIREDISVDEFIDIVLGNRKYIKCLFVYNKIDSITIEELDKLAHEYNTIVISCEMDLNLDYLIDQIWKHLNLLRVYTKKRGEYPDLVGGLIVRKGASVEHVCHAIHRSLVDEFRYALVWGTSTKHNPQRVGLSHIIDNEDVIQGMTLIKIRG